MPELIFQLERVQFTELSKGNYLAWNKSHPKILKVNYLILPNFINPFEDTELIARLLIVFEDCSDMINAILEFVNAIHFILDLFYFNFAIKFWLTILHLILFEYFYTSQNEIK